MAHVEGALDRSDRDPAGSCLAANPVDKFWSDLIRHRRQTRSVHAQLHTIQSQACTASKVASSVGRLNVPMRIPICMEGVSFLSASWSGDSSSGAAVALVWAKAAATDNPAEVLRNVRRLRGLPWKGSHYTWSTVGAQVVNVGSSGFRVISLQGTWRLMPQRVHRKCRIRQSRWDVVLKQGSSRRLPGAAKK